MQTTVEMTILTQFLSLNLTDILQNISIFLTEHSTNETLVNTSPGLFATRFMWSVIIKYTSENGLASENGKAPVFFPLRQIYQYIEKPCLLPKFAVFLGILGKTCFEFRKFSMASDRTIHIKDIFISSILCTCMVSLFYCAYALSYIFGIRVSITCSASIHFANVHSTMINYWYVFLAKQR